VKPLTPGAAMTDAESRLARLEERAADLEEWKNVCQSMPVMLAELVQWKKDQNGDLRQLKQDVAVLREAALVRRGWETIIKWATVAIGTFAVSQILEWVYATLASRG
jgi:hypothetical protein